ncbi:hypothetical protein [Asaia sp. HN128]|uniref:hypothetical protein n=1 Tax=Asaia sp. HN128 TaxID=3081234 RepID=UPI003016C4A5
MVDPEHIAELEKNGVKFSKEKLVATGRLPDGKVFFLEEGTKASGLRHIVDKHGSEFEKKGIAQSDIPKVIRQALSEGKIVGYQGEGTGRPIFQTTVNGSELNIAITVSENGYIVGANMRGARK